MVGNEPCLSDKMSLYTGILSEIQENCDKLNELIDRDIKSTTERLKSSRVLQEQVNREIMMFVKEKLA